jgi:hypothetical protein
VLRLKPVAITVLAASVLSLAGVATAAHADPAPLTLYTIANAGGALYSIDQATGAASPVGSGTGIPGPAGAALDPISKTMYVLSENCDLYTLDMTSGIGATTGFTVAATIAAQPINHCTAMTIGTTGTAYASVQTAVNNDSYFVTLDLATGVTTQVGPQLNAYYDWISINPIDSVLYGQNDDSGQIYSVNATTGVETPLTGTAWSDYGYGFVIGADGMFYLNRWNDLASGSLPTWSSSTVGSFGDPLNSEGNGSMILFTTTDVFPAPATPSIAPATQDVTAVLGQPLAPTAPLVPTNFAPSPTFSIFPALPTGMSIDPETGVISGTPTAAQASTEYTITASNGTQSATAVIAITVGAAAATTPTIHLPVVSG